MNPKYTPEFLQRFWSKVDCTAGLFECWLWTASLNKPGGYGRIGLNGSNLRVHRISYELAFGSVPIDLHVLHKCDNPPCVNPSHLFLGTQLDNVRDMQHKSRDNKAHHERVNTSKLTVDQVMEIRRLYDAGGMFQHELGKMFGVSQQNIFRIVHGETWR